MSQPRQVLAGRTYFISRRCIDRKYYLLADSVVNQCFMYCLAVASQRFAIQIHGYCMMSNHYHLVVTDTSAQLPLFMAWFNRHMALCIKLHRGIHGVVWEPNVPYSAVQLWSAEAVYQQMGYTMANPVTAGLVRRAKDWAGPVSLPQDIQKQRIEVQRPRVYFKGKGFEQVVHVELSQPAILQELSHEEYINVLECLLAEREQQAQAHHTRLMTKKPRFWDRPIQRPWQGPKRNPQFAGVVWEALRQATVNLRAFRQAYRAAFEQWRQGIKEVLFPPGTYWVVRYAAACTVPL